MATKTKPSARKRASKPAGAAPAAASAAIYVYPKVAELYRGGFLVSRIGNGAPGSQAAEDVAAMIRDNPKAQVIRS